MRQKTKLAYGLDHKIRVAFENSLLCFRLPLLPRPLLGPAGVDGQDRGIRGFPQDVPLVYLGFVFRAWRGGPPYLPAERTCERQYYGGASQRLPG